jgi:integrase
MNASQLFAKGGKFAFKAALDSRGKKIKGLYLRGNRFYGRLWTDGMSRRFPLTNPDGSPLQNLTQAREAYEELRHARRKDALPSAGMKTGFRTFAQQYLDSQAFAGKRNNKTEKCCNLRWQEVLGDVPLNKVTRIQASAWVEKRLKSGVSKGTINVDLVALRNVLRAAKEAGLIKEVPPIKNSRYVPARKKLVTPEQVEALLTVLPKACQKNGEQVGDYLRFLAYSGAREQEGLHVRWEDVDFRSRRVWFNHTKGGSERHVDFNEALQLHLLDMYARRGPSAWLFPSPRRGDEDRPAETFRYSLKLARAAAGLRGFGFHDLRHFFASYCVMSGVDIKTVAAWLGHKDGGLLVSTVYGHLSDSHMPRMAAMVRFGNRPAASAQPKST